MARTYQFRAAGDRSIVGSITTADDRLERAIDQVLSASPLIVWDRDAEVYEVDLSTTNPPHLLPAAARSSSSPAPSRSVADLDDRRAVRLNQNPKWRGLADGTGYRSRLGWRLDYVADRGLGLKRGERGKHWRLSLEGAPASIFYRSKREATAEILSGAALKRVDLEAVR